MVDTFDFLTFRVRGKLVVAVAGARLSAIMPKESIGDCSTVECAAAAAGAAAVALPPSQLALTPTPLLPDAVTCIGGKVLSVCGSQVREHRNVENVCRPLARLLLLFMVSSLS